MKKEIGGCDPHLPHPSHLPHVVLYKLSIVSAFLEDGVSKDKTLVAFDVIISVTSLGDLPVIVSASSGQPLKTLFRIRNIYSRDEDKQSHRS